MTHTAHHALPLTMSSIITRAATPLCADVGDHVVVMSTEQGKYYDLDAISSDIWRRLDHPVRVADLCTDLHNTYEGDHTVMAEEVLQFLGQLIEQNLVSVQPA